MYRILISGILFALQASCIQINVPASVPQNASSILKTDFLGLAFEETSFVYYAGNKTHRDLASRNLVENIANKTNTRPLIRVGGTSLDNAYYNTSLKTAMSIPAAQAGQPIPSTWQLGPSFFDSFDNFPTAQYVVNVRFEGSDLNNSITFTRDAYRYLGKDKIFALELGNEPNNYPGATENKTQKEMAYSEKWGRWSEDIGRAMGFGNASVWQGVALSAETGVTHFPGGTADDWKIPELFESGLKQYSGRMKTVAMHYYQTASNPDSNIQSDIMNHTAVVAGTDFVKQAINYLNQPDFNIPVYLAEIGSTLSNTSKDTPLESSLATALWQVDFSLYAMSMGVAGLNSQLGDKYHFSLWLPTVDDTPGQILPAYYGHLLSAEFLGPSGNTRVANINLGTPFVSAYGAYDNGKLARVVILNFDYWDKDSSAEKRPSMDVSLDVGGDATHATVKKLTSLQGAEAYADSITLGGMQWLYEDGGVGKMKSNDTVTLPVKNGNVDLEIKSSEAVLISLI